MNKAFTFRIMIVFFIAALINSAHVNNLSGQTLQEPEKYFGFKPGADRMLISYDKLVAYLQKLDEASDKMKMMEIGKTDMGKPMYVCFISSEKNIRELEALKAINKRLALDPEIPETELNELIAKGKVFFLATLSMHSTEVGPTQAFPLVAYELLTQTDEQSSEMLDKVVFMVVPNSNPDGMNMIVDHFNKYKGTKYEKSSMPGVYNKYVGHDNNRDFVNLSQVENKNIARLYNTEWYPQVMNDKHQMGMTGPRYFVPPYHDPIAENIEAELWNWAGVFGSNMIKDMTADGLAGVSQRVYFDNYWPGSAETCLWKNVVSYLTECASTFLASPVFIEPSELNVYGKGLAEYKISTNMPLPWPGGWWKLSDIVDYEVSSAKSNLLTASQNREKLLKLRNDLCKKQLRLGKTKAPYYYILPEKQHDKGELISLIKLMQEHGVIVNSLSKSIRIDARAFEKGDIVISLSQAYRAFVKEVMEKQKFPERHYMPGGEIIEPYDITNWSLPLNKGLNSYEIETRSLELESSLLEVPLDYSFNFDVPDNYSFVVLSANFNESYKIAFEALEQKIPVSRLEIDFVTDKKEILPAGSFVMEQSKQVNELLKTASINPVYLDEKQPIKTAVMKMPRIAFVETWFHDMEAGWTRFILDSYHIPFTVIHLGEMSAVDLDKNFDVLILSDNDKDLLMEGKYKREGAYRVSNYPPEYVKGFGSEGFDKILSFVDNGGIILAWGESTKLFTGTLSLKQAKTKEEFKLPFDNNPESYIKNGLYVPGALFRVKLTENHPLTFGMEGFAGVFYEGQQVFSTRIPTFDMDRKIIATFPEENMVLSGYAVKSEQLENKPAMVWVSKGKGQFVFYAFSPTNRASTSGVYKLLFNGLLLNKMK